MNHVTDQRIWKMLSADFELGDFNKAELAILLRSRWDDMESELTALRRFKAAALTLTTQASVDLVMGKETT